MSWSSVFDPVAAYIPFGLSVKAEFEEGVPHL